MCTYYLIKIVPSTLKRFQITMTSSLKFKLMPKGHVLSRDLQIASGNPV